MTTVDPSKVYRTPDSRFKDLPDFPYAPRYDYFRGLRYAWIEETSPVAFHEGRAIHLDELATQELDIHWETYLCLHGEPTWSYLYRRMIPILLQKPPPQGSALSCKFVRRRVLAPDYIGFGRSDKPVEDEYYTWEMHRSFLVSFIRKRIQDESNFRGSVVGVFPDWGGVLGLTLPLTFPKLFTHLLIMNTAFGTGESPSKGWSSWREFMKRSPDVDVGRIIGRSAKHLTLEEIRGYDAPHPNHASKAGVRQFPEIVPLTPTMDGAALSRSARTYYQNLIPNDLRVFVVIGMADPVLGESVMKGNVVPAFECSTGCWVLRLSEAGHFVQEWGNEVAEKAIELWSSDSDENARAQGADYLMVRRAKL